MIVKAGLVVAETADRKMVKEMVVVGFDVSDDYIDCTAFGQAARVCFWATWSRVSRPSRPGQAARGHPAACPAPAREASAIRGPWPIRHWDGIRVCPSRGLSCRAGLAGVAGVIGSWQRRYRHIAGAIKPEVLSDHNASKSKQDGGRFGGYATILTISLNDFNDDWRRDRQPLPFPIASGAFRRAFDVKWKYPHSCPLVSCNVRQLPPY